MPPVSELTFRRATISLTDAARLGEGEDLNDALLDFFMKMGQMLIPRGSAQVPVAYLGALFYNQLTSAFVGSGEEGWKNVQNWSKRKAGGLFSPHYAAFAVPINEDLKDDKGQPAGNHWWLALVLNPPGGATAESTAVMCLDSMQRREKIFDPPVKSNLEGSLNRYALEVTKMEQAGYLIIITFDAKGDGKFGPLQRPEKSRLVVDGFECTNPTIGLRINMPGDEGVPGRFEGTLTFALDGRVRSSTFDLDYGEEGYTRVRLQFDPFTLTKMQKNVSRYLGGYLAKEWEVNGPTKNKRFEKQSARALVADVHQQENLNDCGVFVLENVLRSLSMKPDFLKTMAEASPEVLKTFPWPFQADITARKAKLKAIVARLFAAGAEKGTSDVEKLLKEDAELRAEALRSLTDEIEEDLDKWSGQLQKELAARHVDKDNEKAQLKRKEEEAQARRDEERRKKEEEERKVQEEKKKQPKRRPASPSSSPSRPKRKKSEPVKKKSKPPSEDSSSSDRRKKKKKSNSKSQRKRGRSSSRSSSCSSSRSRSRRR